MNGREELAGVSICNSVIGCNSNVAERSSYNVIVGFNSKADGNRNIIVGNNNDVHGSGNLVIGNDQSVMGDHKIVIVGDAKICASHDLTHCELIKQCALTINESLQKLISMQENRMNS